MIWGPIGTTTAVLTFWVCLDYNRVAGTDKTPFHIAQTCASVFSGPLIGPIANPGACGEAVGAVQGTVILLGLVLLGLSAFVFVRRPVSWYLATCAWLGFTSVCIAWFLGSMISLAFFLS